MKLARLLTLAMLLAATPAFAGQSALVEEWSLYPSFQYFTWNEFVNGARLVKEEGLLVGVGGTVNLDLYARRLMLKIRGEVFGGDVDYDGSTQTDTQNPAISQRPVKTDVIYFGTKVESDAGWRFTFPAASVEPFAGLGYRWWLRGIEDSTSVDTNGNPFPVGGYVEYWQSIYARAGVRFSWRAGNGLTMFAEGGGKYPFYNQNRADYPGTNGVTVKPRGDWSAFGEIGLTYRRFRPTIFYEGFRYSQSATVPISPTQGLLQPRSESDLVGVSFGWLF